MHQAPEMKRCIELCHECQETCLATVAHCLEKGGLHAEASHVRLLLDCSQICQTSADFMVRGSDLHVAVCRTCAEICERCAENCARFDDETMRQCAEVCRQCVESCAHMAGAAAH